MAIPPEVYTIGIGIVAAILIMKFIKKIVYLVGNTIAGLVALFILKYLTPLDIAINFFTVLAVIIGGIFGLIAVVIMSLL
jgi:hypothetical protein